MHAEPVNTNLVQIGLQANSKQSVKSGANEMNPRATEYRRLIESLRVMLGIIAGLLMLDTPARVQGNLSLGVIAFSAYAAILLWKAANGASVTHHRIFYWLDACWFLMLLFLAGEARTHYFLFLYFPVFFAAWRTGYRESVAIAVFSGLAALVLIQLSDPGIPWARLLTLPLSLLFVGPIFVALARDEATAQMSQVIAATIVDALESRRDIDSIIPDLIPRIATHMGASSAILALRTFEARNRVFCWEAENGSSELSETAAASVADQVLSLAPEVAHGWSRKQRWWRHDRRISIGSSGQPLNPTQSDRAALTALLDLVGRARLFSAPLAIPGIGRLQLLLAGDSIDVSVQSLTMLVAIVEKIGPSIENAFLRERLATEAVETERARIGRDLHDSAIQPYIGLKFGLEAVQHRAGPDNPVSADLASLVEMATEELTTMRDVISGLRGSPGSGGALLSSAVRRQAARFGQLFGMQVEVEVQGEMPVSRRIAGELFHIVAEGLSNIRRHTQARRAWISLTTAGGLLILSIRNEKDPQAPDVPDFVPISLSERAAALGGSVKLDRDSSYTSVTVSVPISGRKKREE